MQFKIEELEPNLFPRFCVTITQIDGTTQTLEVDAHTKAFFEQTFEAGKEAIERKNQKFKTQQQCIDISENINSRWLERKPYRLVPYAHRDYDWRIQVVLSDGTPVVEYLSCDETQGHTVMLLMDNAMRMYEHGITDGREQLVVDVVRSFTKKYGLRTTKIKGAL